MRRPLTCTALPIKTVAAKRTVLVVEHNPSVVENLCDSEILAAGGHARASRSADVIQGHMGSDHE